MRSRRCANEGILPAIELGPRTGRALQIAGLHPKDLRLIDLSGRGDKDVDIAARWFGHLDGHPEPGHVEHGPLEHGANAR